MRISAYFSLGVLVLSAVACTGSESNPRADEAISREAFVEAYRQLRAEALRSPEIEISIQGRDRILADLGLTEEDLLTFVDVWGTNGDFMRGIWEEVDSIMQQERRRQPDDPPRGGPDPDESEEENVRRLGRGRG